MRKRKSFLEEMRGIPPTIRDNPHILRRMNVHVPPKAPSIPRAALSPADYRAKTRGPLAPYSAAVLNGTEGDRQPSRDELQVASSQLRDLQHELVDRGDYVGARAAYRAYVKVNDRLQRRATFEKDKSDIEALICKRNELIALVQATADDWDGMIADHAARTKAQLTELDERHEEELNEFDRNTPEDLAPLFRRNSVTYLKMRSKERNLANNTHFNQAIALQAKADIVEQQEREANFEAMDIYYRHKKRRLRERQARVFDGCAEFATIRRDEMIHARDRSIRGQRNRIENLEKAIVLKCEQRGIKQGQINLDLVDEERVAKIRAHEDSNPVSNKRAASAMTRGRPSTAPIASPNARYRRVGTPTSSKASSQSDYAARLPVLVSEPEEREREPALPDQQVEAQNVPLPELLNAPATKVTAEVQTVEPDELPQAD
jgi:hypothetical protein